MPAEIFQEAEMKGKQANQQMLPPHLNSLGLSCTAGPGAGSRTAHGGLKRVLQSRGLCSSALV